ncbi:MAG TPA: AAA family ATPase, partial [Phycisphaerae bacterium]|nr:AAA family ATPase [Phycisphaerae bacterium]
MNAARTLTETLVEHVRAACTGLWVQSHEHADALAEICRVAAAQPAPWTIALWDCDRGLSVPSFRGRDAERHAGAQGDPLAAIRSLRDLAPEADDGATVLVLPNFHRFLDSAEIVQALAGELFDGRGRRTFVLILSPIVSLPVELERMFVVLDHPLPDAGELEQIALGVAEARDFPPDAADRRRLLDAAAGMTRLEAETAMALSLVRHGRLDVRTIWECKAQMLRRSGLLRL